MFVIAQTFNGKDTAGEFKLFQLKEAHCKFSYAVVQLFFW